MRLKNPLFSNERGFLLAFKKEIPDRPSEPIGGLRIYKSDQSVETMISAPSLTENAPKPAGTKTLSPLAMLIAPFA